MRGKTVWHDLLRAWLKSMGCEIFDSVYRSHCRFYYQGRHYEYYVGIDIIDISLHLSHWADINLKTSDVDPCNPSFDPDKFFSPLKEWMEI